jgi:hypothetical protein
MARSIAPGWAFAGEPSGPYHADMTRLVTRLAVIGTVTLSMAMLGGCYYRYPYKVKKKPSSCPYKRPAKKKAKRIEPRR